MSRITLLILVVLPTLLGAQSYLWPTDASPYLTSSFGEYRSRHFHAGLDIKSWNTPGYKVFAIDDGYLWRIRTSNTGYGKVLYQKLSDGRIAVYAHLDRFADQIDEFVYNRQQQTGSYETDFFPRRDQFPLQRGDVIAFTGNTGSRYPHLHFEIRSPDNEPLNPLALGLSIEDVVPPTPQNLVVTPLEASSTVNGKPFIQMPRVRSEGTHRYTTDPVTVSGTFGLEIQAFDGVNAVYNKYSIYGAEVLHADTTVFQFQYDRFSFSHTHLITIERNYGLHREDLGRFQRLYKTVHTRRLPFYPENLDGRIDLPPGEHTLIVLLRDFNGNAATVEVPVTVLPRSDYTVRWNSFDTNVTASVFPADSLLIPGTEILGTTNPGQFTPITPHTTRLHGDTLTLTWNRQRDSHSWALRVTESALEQGRLFPFDTVPDTAKISFTFHWIYTPHGMIPRVITDRPLTEQLELEVLSPSSDTAFAFRTADLTEWYTQPIPVDLLDQATYVLGSRNRVFRILPENTVAASQTGESVLRSRDGTVELHVKDNTLYYPSLIWSENQEPSDPEFLSPIWSFGPHTVPFRNPAQIRVRPPEVTFPMRQLGIYYSEDDSEWKYLPAVFSADSSLLVGEILSLESFTLRRDSLPPEIFLRQPAPGSASRSGSPDRIEYTVRDQHSGIPGSKSIQLLVDGAPVIFEFNPITKILTYRLRHPLEQGTHSVRISAVDAAGNYNEQSYTFTVR